MSTRFLLPVFPLIIASGACSTCSSEREPEPSPQAYPRGGYGVLPARDGEAVRRDRAPRDADHASGAWLQDGLPRRGEPMLRVAEQQPATAAEQRCARHV